MSVQKPKSFAAMAATAILLLSAITLADTPIIKRGPLILPRQPFLSGVGGLGGISTLAPLFPAPRRFAVSPFNRPFSITTYHIDATPSPLLSGGGYEGQLNFFGAPSLNVPALSAPNLTTGNYLDRRVYYGPPSSQQPISGVAPRVGVAAPSSPNNAPPPTATPQTYGFRNQPRPSAGPPAPVQWRSPMRARLAEEEAQPNVAVQEERQVGICLGRGDMAFEIGQYDKACEEYARAISITKSDAAAHLSLGLSEFAAGRYQRAAKSLRAGLSQGNAPAHSSLNLISCYSHRQEFVRQVSALEAHLDSHSADADAWLVLSFVRYYGGDVYAARRATMRYSALRPADDADAFIRQVRAGS
jgi:hypothetical protein